MIDNESKNMSIGVRVSGTERILFEAMAKNSNMTVSNFMRKILFDDISEEEASKILKQVNPDTKKTVSREDLHLGKNAETRSIAIQMTKEEIADIDKLCEKVGVPRAVFLRNRLIMGKQIICNVNLNIEDIENCLSEVRKMNRENSNILKMLIRSEGIISEKEKQLIIENNIKIEQATRSYLSNVKSLQKRVDEVTCRIVKQIVEEQLNKTKGGK